MDVLTVRNLTTPDLWKITWWWPAHKWEAPPADLLPSDGVIVEKAGTPTAVGFLYLTTNSKCAWVEWLVTNPSNSPRVSAASLRLVIATLLDMAKRSGVKFVYSSLKNKGLIRLYERLGFRQGDVGCTDMIKGL